MAVSDRPRDEAEVKRQKEKRMVVIVKRTNGLIGAIFFLFFLLRCREMERRVNEDECV